MDCNLFNRKKTDVYLNYIKDCSFCFTQNRVRVHYGDQTLVDMYGNNGAFKDIYMKKSHSLHVGH